MAVIDADAHVVETERTWEHMEEAESPFKPEVVIPKAGGDREYWLIEGRAFAKNTNIGKDMLDEAREVSNITPGWPIWTRLPLTCMSCIRRSSCGH